MHHVNTPKIILIIANTKEKANVNITLRTKIAKQKLHGEQSSHPQLSPDFSKIIRPINEITHPIRDANGNIKILSIVSNCLKTIIEIILDIIVNIIKIIYPNIYISPLCK
jgi:hypothetical protein